MDKIKVLNLYAGIGGNRNLWENVDVTAVELDPKIAKVYSEYYPEDKVIVGDAHDYLLHNYKEFDFIWASPPCPSHSEIRRCGVHKGQCAAIYPEMSLYQEIILLKYFALKSTKWVVENVRPYYPPFIKATEIDRHLFWSNFNISQVEFNDGQKIQYTNTKSTIYGINIVDEDIDDKRKTLRNMVNPKVGLHILKESQNTEYDYLF